MQIFVHVRMSRGLLSCKLRDIKRFRVAYVFHGEVVELFVELKV